MKKYIFLFLFFSSLFSNNLKNGDILLTYSNDPVNFFIKKLFDNTTNSENFSHSWIYFNQYPSIQNTFNIYSMSFDNLAEKGFLHKSLFDIEKKSVSRGVILRPKLPDRFCFDFYLNKFISKKNTEFDWYFKKNNNKFYCFELIVSIYEKCFPEALLKKTRRLDDFDRFNLNFFYVERFHND
jgi:hypothetical protein